MRAIMRLKPKKIKKMNKDMTRRFKRATQRIHGTPVEKLEREAVEFEKLIFNRRLQ